MRAGFDRGAAILMWGYPQVIHSLSEPLRGLFFFLKSRAPKRQKCRFQAPEINPPDPAAYPTPTTKNRG
nr:MAG TPA: hypothetical protein [Caudoviricetes sp.]